MRSNEYARDIRDIVYLHNVKKQHPCWQSHVDWLIEYITHTTDKHRPAVVVAPSVEDELAADLAVINSKHT